MVLPANCDTSQRPARTTLARYCRQVFAEILAIWAIAVAALSSICISGLNSVRIDNAPFLPVGRWRERRGILASLLRLLFIPADLGLPYDVHQLGEWHWYVMAALLFALAAFGDSDPGMLRPYGQIGGSVVAPLLPHFSSAGTVFDLVDGERAFVFVPYCRTSLLLATVSPGRGQPLAGLASVLFVAFAVAGPGSTGRLAIPAIAVRARYRRQPANYIAVRDYVLFNLLPADPAVLSK